MTEETHVTEHIAAYALNCLEPPASTMVAEHLSTCAQCQAELDAYQETIADLALAVPSVTPPATLKQRLLSDKKKTNITAPSQPVQQSWWQRLGNRPRLQLAGALLILILIASNLLLWQRLTQLETMTVERFSTVSLSGTDNAPAASGLIIISADEEHGTLVVQNLPTLPEDLAYQLWLIRNGGRTSGGVFTVDEDGYRSLWVGAPNPLGSYPDFGVTIEPVDGSPGPTGPKVLQVAAGN